MTSTTIFEFGDVVLVPFPFTDLSASKKRPAVVVSRASFHQRRPDLILLAVTSQVRRLPPPDEVVVGRWQAAGLLKPSAVKPVVMTVQKSLILRVLGHLTPADRAAVQAMLAGILGT